MRKPVNLNVLLILCCISSFLLSCQEEKSPSKGEGIEDYRVSPRPTSGISEFSSDFDSAVNLADLFPDDHSGWTNLQLVDSNGATDTIIEGNKVYIGDNSVELQSDTARSGCCAIRLVAAPSGNTVSKAAMQKGGFFFESGDDLWVSAWFFIEGYENYQSIFLLDIETTEFEGSPGRRIMMSGGDNVIKLESKGNISGSEYGQVKENSIPFPKNQWVQILVHLQLSAAQDGLTEIWQDGVKIISHAGQNLTTERTVYDRLQFGLTANGSTSDKVIYIDDVLVSKQSLLTNEGGG